MEEKWTKIQAKVKDLIYALHEELGWFSEEELENTPKRITRFYREWTQNNQFNFTTFNTNNETTKSMIVLRNITVNSMCSHHLLPFYGKAHIAYLPREGGKICGVSKLARVVRMFASKPQVQEQLTNEIADYLFTQLDAWFVMVRIECIHLCMVMRGVKEHDTVMSTSAIRWDHNEEKMTRNFASVKDEAMRLISGD